MSGKIPSTKQLSLSRRDLLRMMGMSAAGMAMAACAPIVAPAPGAPAVDAPAAAPQEVTVRFWNVWGAAREELMNQIAARFEEEHPGITVENLVQPFENRAENLFASIASSNPPEVLMATRAELLQFANEGLIVPITEYIERDGLDLSAFYDAEIGNMMSGGEYYSLPMPTGGGVTGLQLVNLDMFEAAGMEPVIPETWQQLEDVAREFTILDSRGLVQVGATVTGTTLGGFVGSFFAWLYCNNGQIYSDDLRSTAFDSAEGVETLEWMVNFTNEINGGIQNVIDFFAGPGEATAAQPWYNDTQLINFPNVSIFFHMQTYRPDMGWDMGLRPYNGNNPQAVSQGLSGEEFAWSYVIPQAVPVERREAAFQWIKKIAYDMDGGCWFMQEQLRPSPIRACNEDPLYYNENPHWDKVLRSLESDVSVNILPVHTRVRDAVAQGVQSAMFGDASPVDALAQAATQAQAIIDEYWSTTG
ncbi:MAG: extracellular solute-binding protein [Caldilineaceae bacterium]|nr:extracellular solute-binding protein [Caldilineaceae bacterium]